MTSEKYGFFKEQFVKFDQFGEGFRFKLPDGAIRLKSSYGSIITILTFVILLMYGTLQMQRLVMFG